jgi:membrane peptidoglycan carboxypeptidase
MPRFRLPPRALLLKIVGGVLLALVVIVAVPPLRRAAALGVSKTIVFVATPLAPDIADFKTLPETTKLVAVDGSTIAELDKSQRRVPVDIDKLPDHVKQAVMAAEDQDFYRHDGVDSSAIFRAFLRSAQGRTQGGSTITQQLAKINYTARERTVFRKLKEVLYATQLEKKYSKDELLERYLNQIYFGDGAYGIAAASVTYFAKPPDQLTPAEAALIAGKIRAPEAVDPRKQPKETKVRRDQVLRNMREEGWLDKKGFDAAVATPVELPPAPPKPNDGLGQAPHFTEYVKREARTIEALGTTPQVRANQLFTGGYTVETTFDPKVFVATVGAVQNRLGDEGDPDTAAATIVPGDGAIRSLFGGLNFADTQYDMSSLAGRQLGSSAKPFDYLAALRKGIDPRTTFDGTSGRVVPCYRKEPVNNYAEEDLGGKITVDEALVHSVNVVFAEVGCQAGAKEVKRAAVDAGLPEDVAQNPGTLFLGGVDGKGVNALEMASAYATFAAKGVYAKPYAITKILDSKGRTVYEHKVQTRPAFDAKEVGVLNNPLQDVVKRGTGVAAAIGRPVAGKTGTTQDSIDAWFTGYTPQLATSVWVGYRDNKPMANVHGKKGVTGGSFPAQIFADVMKAALAGVKPAPLFTASPDDLDLKVASSTTVPGPSTTPSSTSSTTTSSSTTTTAPAAGANTTTTAPPATTAPAPRQTTTTTTAPASTTTTTAKKTPDSTTTTTTAGTSSQSATPSTTTTSTP